jgi:hypothetical protein
MNESIYFIIIATKKCQSLSPNPKKRNEGLIILFYFIFGRKKGGPNLEKKFMLFECVSNYVHMFSNINNNDTPTINK